ncbi:hypothetical protein V1511DRAFT_533996 [Dipodascopsis uninucleata]
MGPRKSTRKAKSNVPIEASTSLPASQAKEASIKAKQEDEPEPEIDSEVMDDIIEQVTTTLFDSAQKANTQEKKLSLLLGGYVNRNRTLAAKFAEANTAYRQSSIQQHIFESDN